VFNRPTLPDIVARVEADFTSRLQLPGKPLRQSVVLVLARVLAGAAHMLHGHLEYLAKQLFPDLSDDDFLVRQASLYGLAKTPPTFAHATVTLTGAVGNVISAGHVLTRADGERYTTDADAYLVDLLVNVEVTAMKAGAGPTLLPGMALTFESPVAGVNAAATVLATTADGTDQETTDALRARLLARLADPPRGGSVADYVFWAKLVSGVTRVWVSPLELGAGTIVVRFVRDNDGSIFPDAGEVAVVQAQLDAKKPAHAHVTVASPISDVISITLLRIAPNTAAIRDAVTAAVGDLVLRRATPQGGTIYLSEFQGAIAVVPGISHFRVDEFNRTGDSSDQVFALGHLPVFGTVTFGDFT